MIRRPHRKMVGVLTHTFNSSTGKGETSVSLRFSKQEISGELRDIISETATTTDKTRGFCQLRNLRFTSNIHVLVNPFTHTHTKKNTHTEENKNFDVSIFIVMIVAFY